MTYMVFIKRPMALFCGGCFITEQFVLSVARCFFLRALTEIGVLKKLVVKQYQVYFGSVDRNKMIHSVKIRDFKVPTTAGRMLYPPADDIAVLLVEDTSVFTDTPITTLTPAWSGPLLHDSLTFAGWGVGLDTSTTQGHTLNGYLLREMQVKIVSNDECKPLYCNDLTLNEKYVCGAPEKRGESPANGDTGSPLVFGDAVLGLHTFDLAGRGIYTRVSYYHAYIEESKRKLLEDNPVLPAGRNSRLGKVTARATKHVVKQIYKQQNVWASQRPQQS